MASHVIVEVNDLQKVTVKTTPAMLCKDILSSALQLAKDKRDPLQCGLMYKRQVLDLSLSCRFAQLAAGARLEVINVQKSNNAGAVKLALQCDDGNRWMTEPLSSTSTLWAVLLHVQRTANVDLTRRVGLKESKSKNVLRQLTKQIANAFKQNQNEVYYQPIVQYCTIDQLQSTTLQDCGLSSGNGLLRLTFRPSELTLEQVWSQLEAGDNEAVITAVPVASSIPPAKKAITESTSKPVVENTEIQDPLTRKIVVYAPPILAQSAASIELPDDFFELSPDELRLVVARQRSQTRALIEGAPLRTAQQREEAAAKQASRYPKSLIRVRLPDGHSVDFSMLSSETLQDVAVLLKSVLNEALPKWILIVPGSGKLNDSISLLDHGLVPKALVHVAFEERGVSFSGNYIASSWQEKMQPFPEVENKVENRIESDVVMDVPVEENNTNPIIEGSNSSNNNNNNDPTTHPAPPTTNKPSTGRPKWFKMK